MKIINISLQFKPEIGPCIILHNNKKEYILCICHHHPDRSIPFLGIERFFCARCLGIIFGIIIGVFLLIFGYQIPFILAFIMIIPLIMDGFSQFFGFRESNNHLRLITGLSYGVATINYLISQLLL